MASTNPFTGAAWGQTTPIYPSTVAQSSTIAATQLVKQVNSIVALDNDSNILDLGAGTGATTFVITRNYPSSSQVLAADFSSQMLQTISAQRDPRVSTQVLDALEVKTLGPQRFSHVFSTFMLQFILQPAKVISGIYDILQPGGMLGLGLWHGRPMIFDIWEGACQTIDPSYHNTSDFLDPHAWTTPEQVRTELEKAGFVDVSVNDMVLPFRFESAQAFVDFMTSGGNPYIQFMIEQWTGDRQAAIKAMERICREDFGDGEGVTLRAMNFVARKPVVGR